MTLISALDALDRALTQHAGEEALSQAIDAVLSERAMLQLADQRIIEACCQAASGHRTLAVQSLALARGLVGAASAGALIPDAVARLDGFPWDECPEDAHKQADAILLDVLRSNGLGEVADAWYACKERVGFWYA